MALGKYQCAAQVINRIHVVNRAVLAVAGDDVASSRAGRIYKGEQKGWRDGDRNEMRTPEGLGLVGTLLG